MATNYYPGQVLQRGDLDIYLVDSNSVPLDAYEISYNLFYVDPNPPSLEVLIPPAHRTPAHPSVGEYYAALMVPPAATLGTYRIRWTIKQTSGSPEQTVVQEFEVVDQTSSVQTFSAVEIQMIRSLRILIRDQKPDKFYHFRPPEHEGNIGQFNRVFGQVWEDIELKEYLERSLDWWNMFPPETEMYCSLEALWNMKSTWRTTIYWGAIIHALFALALNWVHEEFSIGGEIPVRVVLPDGSEHDIPIEDLYRICKT